MYELDVVNKWSALFFLICPSSEKIWILPSNTQIRGQSQTPPIRRFPGPRLLSKIRNRLRSAFEGCFGLAFSDWKEVSVKSSPSVTTEVEICDKIR